eukprot:Rhum_TRINITY_DN4565_c0_g1::Rhum_TRINITY_DN4565_c0_g1_i1::g.14854::m.14854/K14809/DDX55, SPB4; ATP-dependent RNA helicase DDX55/SPB4
MSRGNIDVLRVSRKVEPIEKTADDAVLTEVWESMRPKLSDCLKRTLRNVLFFSHATNIQRMTVPLLCREGVSVRVQASTGSGKTLAFLLPVLHRVLRANEESIRRTTLPIRDKKVIGIVLSPSRTLSRQTFIICRQLASGSDHNLKVVTFGDTNKCTPFTDMQKFDKVPNGGGVIVVATPESLLKVLDYCASSNKARQYGHGIEFARREMMFIVDEADVVMDSAYDTVQAILEYVRPEKEVELEGTYTKKMKKKSALKGRATKAVEDRISFGLFGATVTSTESVGRFIKERGLAVADLPQEVAENSIVPVERDEEDNIINEVADVAENPALHHGKIYSVVDTQTTLINLKNNHIFCPAKESLSLFIHLLNKHPRKKHFIFFNNSATLEYVALLLSIISKDPEKSVLWQMTPYCLHSGISEADRSERFQNFLSDEKGILLSTDECAFGIDVREVDYVLHFQPPNDTRVYVHRIGRTGRMGCVGTSTLLLPAEAKDRLDDFIDELHAAFESTEQQCPNIFSAAPLIGNLLAYDENVRTLAMNAACAAMQESAAGQSAVPLSVSLQLLGMDEAFAHQMMQLFHAETGIPVDEDEERRYLKRKREREEEAEEAAAIPTGLTGAPARKKRRPAHLAPAVKESAPAGTKQSSKEAAKRAKMIAMKNAAAVLRKRRGKAQKALAR